MPFFKLELDLIRAVGSSYEALLHDVGSPAATKALREDHRTRIVPLFLQVY
jgi:hypothetical protein